MKATIWHNPGCSKSRETLALLEAHGADIEIVRYLEAPPSAARLAALYARAGMRPGDGLRRSEPGADALALRPDGEVLAAMAASPALIERPLVETARGVRLCRPPARVRDIL